MKTIAKAFVDLAGYLEIAKFDDPDEAQGAQEVVSWCLSEASDVERGLLREALSQTIAQLRADGAPPEVVDFYESFLSRIKNVG